MYCIVQEVELKKADTHGEPKEIETYETSFTIQGIWHTYYHYRMSEERFERPVKKAYKLTLRISYRENGHVKAKQYSLCTVNYYDFAEGWFNAYDYCARRVEAIAKELRVDEGIIYDTIHAKTDLLEKQIREEFSQTEEFKVKQKHKKIKDTHNDKKSKFAKRYGVDADEYERCYDVFGNLKNKDHLEKIKEDYEARKEYERQSRSYQEHYYSNYNNYGFGGNKNNVNIRDTENKETLKQFYRVLSKKFHPDSNPDTDTSKQMKLLNQLKDEWGV